ncbi:MAG: hypothetical protein RLW61_00005, partial [Gammaproteobacteria bacterium]
MKLRLIAAALATACCATTAHAAFDLRVTEIWPGNEPGSNLTEDWFELTNYGASAWTAAVDGNLYYDDESADSTTADLMSGVASIAAGESVVFVNGNEAGRNEWLALWAGDLASVPQVGYFNGAGLSQGGDAVAVFLDTGFDGPTTSDLLGVATYPDAESTGGQSYDLVLAAFSTVGNAAGAIATTGVNNASQPSVGSPGS